MKYINPIIIIILLIYLLNLRITLKPFKIVVEDWMTPVATLLIVVAILLISVKSYQQGKEQGYNQATKDLLNELKKYEK